MIWNLWEIFNIIVIDPSIPIHSHCIKVNNKNKQFRYYYYYTFLQRLYPYYHLKLYSLKHNYYHFRLPTFHTTTIIFWNWFRDSIKCLFGSSLDLKQHTIMHICVWPRENANTVCMYCIYRICINNFSSEILLRKWNVITFRDREELPETKQQTCTYDRNNWTE